MRKEALWNSIQAAGITGLLAVIGWLSLTVISLQNQRAADDAESELRQRITDVMNDVDKRLAVIEALISHKPESQRNLKSELDNDSGDDSEIEFPTPSTESIIEDQAKESDFDGPRYDFRKAR